MADQGYGEGASPAGSHARSHGSPQPPLWYTAAVPVLLAVLAGVMVIAGS